jgi:uncharacterized protein YbbC (DUF1343 family)
MSRHFHRITGLDGWRRMITGVGVAVGIVAFGNPASAQRDGRQGRPERVRPGITVLFEERIGLVQGRRVALITNQTGVNEKGESDIELLTSAKAKKARIELVALFSPEHGIRGTEDRANLSDERDARSGLMIHSLYAAGSIAPADSLLRGVQTVIVDLQDSGTRTWTYVGVMLYAMRAAARNHIPVLILDRPNPITGDHVEGPILDSALANSDDPAPGKPGKAYALYPVPLRHGMTMGEMALLFNSQLHIGAILTVVPVRGWRRSMWLDETHLPWVKPSPNLPSLKSVLLYPGLVAFEATNVSVGRGTGEAFQRVGAPWLKAREVVELLSDRLMPGVKFEMEHFTPVGPTDGKYAGKSLPGIRINITDREHANPSRIGAALLWAIAKTSPDSLTINPQRFDERFGVARVRIAIVGGEDPDSVLDRELPATVRFREAVRPFFLYH